MYNKLIEIGFIEYVDSVNRKGEDREIIKKCGVCGKKSFYLLRHTFSGFYKKRHLQNDVFRQFLGHDIPELETKQYGSSFSPKQYFDEVIN